MEWLSAMLWAGQEKVTADLAEWMSEAGALQRSCARLGAPKRIRKNLKMN